MRPPGSTSSAPARSRWSPTGGGLIFGGDGNGRFRALDHETGEVLWEVNLDSQVTGFPIAYAVDGTQYVAISTGSSLSTRDNLRLTTELQPGTGNNSGGIDVVAKAAATHHRTKRRGRHPDKALSAAFVRTAPPGRHADGNGLYLFVQPTGTRSWVQRLVIRGRRRELRLGAAALVPLAKAREQALANRMLARSGSDPLSEKRRVQGVPTFAEAAQRVLEQKRGGWRGRWHAQNWWWSLERYAFPRIGSRPVSEVNTADVLEVLTPIWHIKAETARALRQRIRSVLEWAIEMDLRNDNPCDRVLPVLGPQNDIVTHRLALPHRDMAAAVQTVRVSGSGQPAVKLAFEFLVLTAARSAEVRLARGRRSTRRTACGRSPLRG